MKANELRIGNVILNSDGIKQKVGLIGNLIGVVNFDEVPVFSAMDIASLKPAPLTTDILNQFGFNQIRIEGYDKGWYHKYLNHGLYGGVNGYTFVDSEGSDISFERRIKFVHELQNLFFSLTGSELELR